MQKFLSWTFVFVIAIGLLLHFKVEIPYLSNWIGSLPGDVIVMKGHNKVPLPIASAAIFGLVISFFHSLLFKKK